MTKDSLKVVTQYISPISGVEMNITCGTVTEVRDEEYTGRRFVCIKCKKGVNTGDYCCGVGAMWISNKEYLRVNNDTRP